MGYAMQLKTTFVNPCDDGGSSQLGESSVDASLALIALSFSAITSIEQLENGFVGSKADSTIRHKPEFGSNDKDPCVHREGGIMSRSLLASFASTFPSIILPPPLSIFKDSGTGFDNHKKESPTGELFVTSFSFHLVCFQQDSLPCCDEEEPHIGFLSMATRNCIIYQKHGEGHPNTSR
jgi:hypothetical protein